MLQLNKAGSLQQETSFLVLIHGSAGSTEVDSACLLHLEPRGRIATVQDKTCCPPGGGGGARWGEQTSGAHLSYRPGRARSISQAPRTGKGSSPAAVQCGEGRREPVRVTTPIRGPSDFIHIDLTSESKPEIYHDAVFTIIIVISDDIVIFT